MKFSTIQLLGIMGIIGAPWVFIDFLTNGLYEHFTATSSSGVKDFLFITGWFCSVLGLFKLGAMGDKKWQRIIMILQLIFLFLVDVWCFIEIIAPDTPSVVSFAFVFLWPLAGFFMLVTGIVILQAKKLKGWKRFIPLFAGIWFLQTTLIYQFTHNSLLSLIISGVDSTIVFSLLGFIVATENKISPVRKSLTV